MPNTPSMDARIAKRLAQKKKKLDTYRPMSMFTVQRLHNDLCVMLTYLGQLARKGKLEATKRGQYWYATKEAVQQYLAEVDTQPRGRPRKGS